MGAEEVEQTGVLVDVCATLRLVQDGFAHAEVSDTPRLSESCTCVLSALVLVLRHRQAVIPIVVDKELRTIKRALRRF